jgi:hypothetical protein
MCALTRSTDGADGLTLHARVVAVERRDLAVDEVLVDLACELRQLVLHIAGNREEHMGRSRGGLTSKIHAVVDAAGLPVQLGLTPGEAHDNRLCPELLARLQPQSMLLADRGYYADWIRALVKQQGAWANIPPKRNRKEPICFSRLLKNSLDGKG